MSQFFSDACLCSAETQEELSLSVSSGNLNIRLLHCVPSHRILHYLLSCVYLIYYQVFSHTLDESKQLWCCTDTVTFCLFNKVVLKEEMRAVGRDCMQNICILCAR